MSLARQLWELLSFRRCITTVPRKLLDFKLYLDNAGLGYRGSGKVQIDCPHLLQRYIFFKEESQIALCVYDITKKESFGVLKNWVEELKNKGP